jgi:hypothetical protein
VPAHLAEQRAKGERTPRGLHGLDDRCTLNDVTKQKRERKERAEAAAKVQRANDRARREREAFAKKLEAAKKASKTTVATGIIDDVEPALASKPKE